jgi:hypothetical protein
MKSILEELFYGNVCPNTDCRNNEKETKELMGYIADHHETLLRELDDKQKEVDDNHRLITELREDRDHYKQGYIEFRDQLDKLQKEFRQFRNETEEEREKMKRDIARNGRQLECLRPFLCGREGCAIRVPVIVSPTGEIEKTIRPEQKQHDIEPLNSDEL